MSPTLAKRFMHRVVLTVQRFAQTVLAFNAKRVASRVNRSEFRVNQLAGV